MKTNKLINGKRLIVALVVVAAIMQLARSSIGICFVVEGESMEPTFKPNDVVQTKASHALTQRGDVVIITDDCGERAIKRIIGMPGETVTVYRGYVYIDGRRLSEPYLAKHTYSFESDSKVMRRIDWRLAKDQYFVMGDNRLVSTDSRKFGPVRRHDIQGFVDLPGNSARPEFCEIVITKTGKAIATGETPNQSQPRPGHPNSNTKI